MDRAEPPKNSVAAEDLYAAARGCANAGQRAVILALASVHAGVEASEAARIWRVDPATLRHALQRFRENGLAGLLDSPAFGKPPIAVRQRRP